ncbi:MAG: hypothetical protein QOH88_3270 [Verrucomicrobiota bacterium]|jgi:hypothetical protein
MKFPLLSPFVAMLLCGCGHLNAVYQNTDTDRQKSVVSRDGGPPLAFIEFGEQGSYQDPTQLQNATDLIKRTPRPLVITYVHGWHNNVKSGDVTRFSRWLYDLSQTQRIRDSGLHLIGVYLGWRGEITDVPVLRQFSFYSRKAAAERLASNFDCYDAIAAVSQAARESHAGDGQYTVLIGHSFGGLVVERAVAHAINAEIHGHAPAERSLPADLILVVNPASDSVLTRQMIAALASRQTGNTRPFLVSLTSTADAATGTAFPASTSLAATTKVFNKVELPGLYDDAEKKHPKRQSERSFYTSTPGHNDFLINHETEKLAETVDASAHAKALAVNLSHTLSGDEFVTDGPNGVLEKWRLRLTGNDVPYWNVKVDPSIIKNHGDIWNIRAQAMMAAIFRMTNPILNRQVKPRAVLKKQPKPAAIITPKAN